MQVSRKLIENVGELKKALNEISVYDFDVYTSMELYYKIANKLNEVIKELMRFEGLVSDEVIKQNEKLIYLLGEGLNTEVVKKINQMVADGTMDTIINHNVFSSLNNKIKETANNICYITPKNFNDDIQNAIEYAFANKIPCVKLEGKKYVLTDSILVYSNMTLEGVKGETVLELISIRKYR